MYGLTVTSTKILQKPPSRLLTIRNVASLHRGLHRGCQTRGKGALSKLVGLVEAESKSTRAQRRNKTYKSIQTSLYFRSLFREIGEFAQRFTELVVSLLGLRPVLVFFVELSFHVVEIVHPTDVRKSGHRHQ